MKETYWGYWLIVLGVFVVVIMLLIQNLTSNSTEDYYTVKQLSEAAMIDAIDYAYYREYGELKINREKFIESFLRRFTESSSYTTEYKLTFAGIYEAPPKVSVEIYSKTNTFVINSDSESFDISNRVDAILEFGSSSNSACSAGVATTNLNGMRGTSLVTDNHAKIYDDVNLTTSSRNASPGIKFTITGENGKYWQIQYEGKCGWVNSDYMAISLVDYFRGKNVEFNITNASKSIYKITYTDIFNTTIKKDIPNVTNEKLYSDDYEDFVPANYIFAQKLAKAVENATDGGDTLVIYDAYRPYSVQRKIVTNYKNLLQGDLSSYRSQILGGFSEAMYIAQGWSNHNYGCAVDLSIKNANMYSGMHELSHLSAKYTSNVRNNKYNYMMPYNSLDSDYTTIMKSDKGEDARKLEKYMLNNTGLRDLASEWWHFEDYYGCVETMNTANVTTNMYEFN